MQEEKENRVKENWRGNLRRPVSKYRWFPTQDDLAQIFFFDFMMMPKAYTH